MTRYLSAFLLLAGFSTAALASTADDTTAYRMVLFLHQVLFVFWLGPDIGVYMWSTKVVNPELTPGQRVSAGRMMRTIDIIPKVCMSLMLTIGGVLTEMKGIEHPWWQMAGIVLLGPVWLTLTLLTYRQYAAQASAKLEQFDLLFRSLVVITVVLSVVYSVLTDRLVDTPWLTGKILLFGAVVFFGIMMRLRLTPFAQGIDQLEADGPSDELDAQLAGSQARSRPFMFAGWLALAVAAGLGIAQPGNADAEPGMNDMIVEEAAAPK